MKEQPIRVRYENPFVVIDYNTIMSGQLSAHEIAVYVVLCAYASSTDKSCFPSYQTIGEKAGISRRKAIDVIAALTARELIEKHTQQSGAGDPTSNLYVIKTLAPAQAPTDNSKNSPAAPVDVVENHVENVCNEASGEDSAPEVVQDKHHPNAQDSLPVVQEIHYGSAYPAPELESINQNYLNQNHSIHQPGATAAEIERLKTEIEYDYFEANMPDKLAFLDCLMGAVLTLRHEAAPTDRRLVEQVDSCTVMDFLRDIQGKSFADVRNMTAYLKKLFFEYLKRTEIELAAIS